MTHRESRDIAAAAWAALGLLAAYAGAWLAAYRRLSGRGRRDDGPPDDFDPCG